MSKNKHKKRAKRDVDDEEKSSMNSSKYNSADSDSSEEDRHKRRKKLKKKEKHHKKEKKKKSKKLRRKKFDVSSALPKSLQTLSQSHNTSHPLNIHSKGSSSAQNQSQYSMLASVIQPNSTGYEKSHRFSFSSFILIFYSLIPQISGEGVVQF